MLRASEQRRAEAQSPENLTAHLGLVDSPLLAGRLLIMLLTVGGRLCRRGNQNASSSQYMLGHVLERRLRCRSDSLDRAGARTRWPLSTTRGDRRPRRTPSLPPPPSPSPQYTCRPTTTVASSSSSSSASRRRSCTSAALRVTCDGAHEAPLTKLAGPTSICDVSAAVLLAFATAAPERRGPARSRAACSSRCDRHPGLPCGTRAAWRAPGQHGRQRQGAVQETELRGYRTVLIIATALWMLRAAACSASMCDLFARPPPTR